MSIRRSFFLVMLSVLVFWGLAHAAPQVPSLKPPAPESPYISKTDEARLRSLFEALDDRNYTTANSLRTNIKGEMAKAVGDWAYLRSPAPGIESGDIDRFLTRYGYWPNASTLRNKAEESFTDETPADTILAYFENRDPASGEGRLQLARAQLAKGLRDAAVINIRKSWIEENWTTSQERRILSSYGSYLTPDDHWKKADRQLFDIRATATRSLIDYVPSDRRREILTRIAFLRSDSNAISLYSTLPEKSKMDAGVLLAAVRYHRRRGNESTAIDLAGKAPLDAEELRNPIAWHYERIRLARWALKNARFEDAYVLSAYSGLESGATFAEAEFMAGWVALRFLNDPERAKAHFAFLSSGVTSPISLARGEYWLGRAFAAANEHGRAKQHYFAAAEFPYAYYGQLAIQELGDEAPQYVFPKEPATIDADSLTTFESRSLVSAMHVLAEVGEELHFDRFARTLDDQIKSEGEVQAYYDLVIGERKTYLAVRAGKVARNNGYEVPQVIYPPYRVPDRAARYVEEPLILGLSRQESEFNPRAFSRARARGLMQLLSSTAQITARKEGIPYNTARLMDDPNYNLLLGAAHLNHLLDRFNGSYIMVLGAYNAGPHRVDQWIETYGDPRSPEVDPIDWVELVPFSETRNYIMRVLENTQVYRSRLEGQPLGAGIMADLTRGGGSREAIGISPPSPRLMMQVSLADPEPTFGVNALNIPSRKTAAQEVFEGLKQMPLHTAPVGGEVDIQSEDEQVLEEIESDAN